MGRRAPGARERLQAAALELYAEHGYGATTVATVASHSGVTERTFFRYFPDKAEVLFADDEGLIEALLANLSEPPSPLDVWEVAQRSLEGVAEELENRRDEMRLRARVIAANPDLAARDVVKHNRVVTTLQEAMRDHGADGHDAALAAGVAGAVFRVVYSEWVTSDGGQDLATRLKQGVDQVRSATG